MKTFLTILSITLFTLSSTAQTSLSGKVTDCTTGEELISANIVIKKIGAFVAGTATDFNGNYSVTLDPGTYDVSVSYIG